VLALRERLPKAKSHHVTSCTMLDAKKTKIGSQDQKNGRCRISMDIKDIKDHIFET